MTSRLKLGAQAMAVGLVALLLALLVWKLVQGSGKKAEIGKPAPNFALRRIDQPGTLQLASLRGKVVVLNFWASWCFPCKQEAPALAAAAKRWAGRVVVLGVDVNDPAGDARRFAHKYGLRYPLVHDNHNVTSPVYGLTGLPETFFIDRRGKLVAHVISEVSTAELRDGVERALRS
ncbi:MAG: cytochrome c biosis protein CcmG, thiol:disulfide interchange protein DsbE [Gaiellaceae bacterium]|jgi:cytochrome c biogenesis protein CcmG/thiol:disulfide interchange protein DsbE|nr:cytochrome c biosis protein CcmG, thiol:disulfide interchange protein DsbE [Gaiellaceae bacterium]